MGQEAGQPDVDEPFDDELYNEAVVFANGKESISVSALQREFRIGYNRASHLIERMEAEHICSRLDSSGRRSIFGGQAL
ncbi:DNA translocase FtsK [Budvicia aquatica]|uniref:DNA translocase FtsK n=1 Tax=Budvicia aquatica TaxID=82979 RepID=UPI002852A2EF|nr:DNA translocase FtsK [Budvicia aquatica]